MRLTHQFSGIGLLLLLLTCSHTALSDDARPVSTDRDQLVLGLLPFVSPGRLARRFEPLAAYLSHKLDFDVVIETAPSFREFSRRTTNGDQYDLLLTAPHLYFVAQRKSGYRVVARVSGPPMQAVIVAPKTSQIVTIDDLRGRKLATPDFLSLGTLLTREHLAIRGADFAATVTLVETPTHNASLQSTANGWTDAASLMGPIFRRMSPQVKSQLRVVAKTASTPHMPLSVAPWIATSRASAFADALIEIENTPGGETLLKQIGWHGFVMAQPSTLR